MRLTVLLVVTALVASLPYVTGRRLLSCSGPRSLVAVSLLSLVGLATSSIFVLAALIDPANLPAAAIPRIVEHCADAAASLFNHPLQHWPRIVAALVLIALLARVSVAFALTLRDSRKGVPPRQLTHGPPSPDHHVDDWTAVDVIDDEEPVAFTAGLVRGRVVVSTGLLLQLDPAEAQALLAHETAHVRGRHTALLFVGRTVSRAFGFLPPARRAAEDLILGLEVTADEAATVRVGSPLIVARALASVAELAARPAPTVALGVAESELLFRVRLLTGSSGRPRHRGRLGSLVVALAASMLLVQLLVLPASGRTLSAAAEAREAHHVCHLPHGGAHGD